MINVTVIKSASKCSTCDETEMIVNAISKNYQTNVTFDVCVYGTPEAERFGIVTTPVVVINNKIYSMGKPVIKEKIENWINKELANA